jgi:formyltetrahydrofolate deformylase
MSEYVLTLSCPDRPGVVHGVSGALLAAGCNILDSSQYLDPDSDQFFLRVHVEQREGDRAGLLAALSPVAADFAMTWDLFDAAPMRVLVLVSRHDHCLADLLFRQRTGALSIDIRAVVSNHPDLEELVRWHGIPFVHLPVTPETRDEQEQRILDLAAAERVGLVVLARYMQVLSPAMCAQLAGRAINIHHSFLPSFPGARPYAQAHARGVKLIGATAHYVTAELDQGPIVEQDVARVDHTHTTEQLTAVGRDVEARVLARAVRWHAEHRVLLNGDRTVVFP